MKRYFSRSSIDALNDDGSHTIDLDKYRKLTREDHARRIVAEWADVDGRREDTHAA